MDLIHWKLNIIFFLLLWFGMWLWIQSRRIANLLLSLNELTSIVDARTKKMTGIRPGFDVVEGGKTP